ncbi:hypothetical protein A2482_05140 [Candidatus Falkowbacteria bacterium RIFOXYC2_FULL_48_21]|uniref:Uncharacterized protein n=1 Tax=Candidatus Falkowbacteria bacterium RIFOXYC2_FULL_48_21 TaxID=1798005 RepID=A0A1F5TBK6_9BACT|nr:MAG: hypothetical protein A2482_05140 [Candidatus Falkowbacteria bacterium RIFOXYC2_FULL_48_21]
MTERKQASMYLAPFQVIKLIETFDIMLLRAKSPLQLAIRSEASKGQGAKIGLNLKIKIKIC